jgi:hypothetical protein
LEDGDEARIVGRELLDETISTVDPFGEGDFVECRAAIGAEKDLGGVELDACPRIDPQFSLCDER